MHTEASPCRPCTVGEGSEGSNACFSIMKKCNFLAPVVVLSFALPGCLLPVWAQEGGSLAETVVTATRTARTADELMQSVEVITRDDIDLFAPATIMDLLETVPGISVARSGGAGKTTSVFLRGANSDHVLVLVNGVRASSATLGEYDWNALQPDQVDRIEVVRGPLASLYGSDAIAGVIQIFTKGKREGWSIAQTIGSNGTTETSLGLSGGDETKWTVSAGSMGTDGIQMRVTDPKRYSFRSANVGVGLDGKLFGDWTYSLGVTHAEGHDESHVSAGPSDFRNQVVDLSLSGRLSPVWRQKVSLYRAANRVTSPAGFPPSDIETNRRQLSWVNELDVGMGALTLGIDRMLEGVSNHNPQNGSVVLDQAMSTTGLFGQYFMQWRGNDLQLGIRRDKHSVYGGVNTYNVALGRQVAEGWRVYASHGTAFKGPTANDVYWPREVYVDPGDCLVFGYPCTSISEGNPNLRPERSRTNEFGVQIDGAAKYRFNLFETRVSNLIDWDSTETGSGATWTETWSPANVGRASMRGVELSVDFRLTNWRIRASATRVLARNDETDTALDRRPENTASLNVYRHIGAHSIRVGLTANSARFERLGTRRLAGFGLVDLSDTIRLGGGWSLRLKVVNLFDKKYALSTMSGVPFATPGREFYVTLRYSH